VREAAIDEMDALPPSCKARIALANFGRMPLSTHALLFSSSTWLIFSVEDERGRIGGFASKPGTSLM